MPQSWDMGQIVSLPLRRKACWGLFGHPKNPTASAGYEPANSGTRGQFQIWPQWPQSRKVLQLTPTTPFCLFVYETWRNETQASNLSCAVQNNIMRVFSVRVTSSVLQQKYDNAIVLLLFVSSGITQFRRRRDKSNFLLAYARANVLSTFTTKDPVLPYDYNFR